MAEDTREVSVVGIGHPLADRVGGGEGDAWVVTESRARVIFLSSSRVNLLATAIRDGRRVLLVTDENSLLTPVFATTWREAGGGWAVREVGGGVRDGFDGRRLSSVEDAGRLPPPGSVDEVAVNYLRPIAADAMQLTAFCSTRHPARETTVLGTPVEWMADAAFGAPPRLWGTHEPLALPWNPTLLTQTIRARMPDETAVYATSPGLTASISAQRTTHGVEEMTRAHLSLVKPSEADFDQVRARISAVLQRLAQTSMPLVGLVLARPGRADLMVPPFLVAPQIPLMLLVGAPAVRSFGLDVTELRERFGAQVVGRPRIPALLFDLGTFEPAAWRRLDDILAAFDQDLLREAMGLAAEPFTQLATDAARPPDAPGDVGGGGPDAQP